MLLKSRAEAKALIIFHEHFQSFQSTPFLTHAPDNFFPTYFHSKDLTPQEARLSFLRGVHLTAAISAHRLYAGQSD